YAWSLDGAATGTNGPSLTVSTDNLTIGIHSVVVAVTGQFGSVTNDATLTVNALTSATDPSDVGVCQGANASFSTVVSGTAPFSYQWSIDGAAAGSNTANLNVNTSVLTIGDHIVRVVVSGQ